MPKNSTSKKPDFQAIKDIKKRVIAMCHYCVAIRSVHQKECLEIAQQAHQLSKDISYRKGEAFSLSLIGFQHWNMSEIDQGLQEVEKSHEIIQEIKAFDILGDNSMVRAMIIWGKGEYERAFSVVYESLDDLEKHGERETQAWLYWSLGVFFHDLKDYKKSMTNYEKADVLLNEFDNPDQGFYSYILIGLGSVHKALENYEEAFSYLDKAREISLNTGHWLEEARANYEIGTVYVIQNNYKEAEEFLWKSYQMRKDHNTKPGMVSSLISLSDLRIKKGENDGAMELLNEALTYAEETKTKPKIYYCHQKLSELFKKKGDFEKAYEHIERFYSIKSEVAGEEASNMLKDLETSHATEKSEREKEIHRLKNVELKKAHDDIAEKNKEITDSINYAKRIQEAILPPEKVVKKHLADSFVLYKPKDIVAGDFYWLEALNDDVYFAAADCTGHGVPGAMVSVVCANALHRAVNEMKIAEPGKILDKVRELVVETFEKSEEEVKDGMDISFCKLNVNSKELTFSGAHNPLYLYTKKDDRADEKTVSNDSHMLLEYKGDKQPIGKYSFEKPFNQHEIKLSEGDIIYVFTDGYPDQFGGENGRKFMYKSFKKLLLNTAIQSMEKQHSLINEAFEKWKGDESQVDDVCVIGVRI